MTSLMSSAGRERGFTLIELMVGVAVGFLVVAGAINLMLNSLGSNRRLLLETRVNQDLRAAADLIARDLRRSGYWANAINGIFNATGTGPVTLNPYRAIAVDTGTPNAHVVEYQFARDYNDTIEDAERAGFKVERDSATQKGVLKFRNGTGGWQAVTDPKVIDVTNLTISEVARVTELFKYCACLTKLTCKEAQFQQGGPTPNYWSDRPRLTIRQYNVVLAGRSSTDASVVREIREAVRVRNDAMTGSCPAV